MMASEATDATSVINRIIDREGGYVDHPDDRGGETNWGITAVIAREAGWTQPMRDMPRSFAERIYRTRYLEAPGFSRVAALCPALAARLVDIGVNMGPPIAIQFLQRALNALNRQGRDYSDIRMDGQIGPATIGALSGFIKARGKAGEAVLITAINVQQGERYIALAEGRQANETFLYGWLSQRVGAF